MDRVLGWLKAAYNFISGDWIVMLIVAVAFLAAWALTRVIPGPAGQQFVAGLVFVALIMLSLVVTLGRERESARRKQRGA
ncbi:MAG TPA: hypothetical protein VIG30_03180 [Ktedonobacterales bacterium]